MSLATSLTDVVPADAFQRAAAGRAAFRLDDLLELRAMLDAGRSGAKGSGDV